MLQRQYIRPSINLSADDSLLAHPTLLMPNLTKRDLVVKISNETGMVQHQVFEVIQKTLDQITTALSKGQDVELRNFGVFQVRLSKARVGRNPNIPGSNFAIPPRATVKFKSGKIMRRDVLALSDNMKKGSAKASVRGGTRNGSTATAKRAANGQN
jgi:nucleoid DNA-binding protein